MPSKRKQPEAERKQWTLGQLLHWHMQWGTRPAGSPAKPGKPRWTQKTLALDCGVSERAVRGWLDDDYTPEFIERLEEALFGDKDAYNEWRGELRDAWTRTRAAQPSVPAATHEAEDVPPAVGIGTTVSLPDRCFGRDADRDRIVAALCAGTSPTAVLVQGPGGIGKTTLTQAAATDAAVVARFGARRWFVALETAADRDTFDAALLTALGLDPAGGFAAARPRLAQAPCLLVLDNLETPWERVGPAIEARLGELVAMPGLAVLASFRGQEAVGGVRWSLRQRVEPLVDAQARTLFLDIADTIALDDPDLPSLLNALGGVPLALCLTARRAAGRAELHGLWNEWQRIGPELAVWERTAPGRLTSVPHSIALSLRSSRVSPDGHRLFALLGQSPAGLAPEDRAALLGDAAFGAEQGLIAVGLAQHRGRRLDLLPPVRDYARRMCAPTREDGVAWCRHFLTLTQEKGERVGFAGGAAAIAHLAPEVPNLEAAMRAATGLGLRAPAVAAVVGLSRLLRANGAGSVLCFRALGEDCRHAGDARGEADCAHWAGEIALRRSDHAAARALYEQARPLYQQVGDVLGEANCIKSLGDIALARSDYAAARALYEQARPLFQQVGDVLGEAVCIARLGEIALARSEHAAARALFEQARPLFQQVGDVLGEANCIRSLGDIALVRSDHAAARARYEQARPLFQQVGDVLGEANCLLGLGRVARAERDPSTARRLGAEALALYETVHATDNIAITHEDLALVTTGAERVAHVAAARAAWAEMDLPDEVARVERRFG